jgi:hypothetical protein
MPVTKLLISGARERSNGFKLGDGKYYEKAVLLQLDLSSGEFVEVLSKTEGGPHYPQKHPNLQFTSGCIDNDILWLPTDTEIYKYQLPDFRQVGLISHPHFQNLHSVHKFGETLVATSTGLDCVILMNADSGEIIDILNAEGKPPWHRFSQQIDYRLVHSTRPHHCHPNFVFPLDGSLWVTRCTQEDAVDLYNTDNRINISMDDEIAVHDGVLWRDKIAFTRVDSMIALFDVDTKQFLRNISPFASRETTPRGWCRGLFIDEDILYFGISKVRETRIKDRLKYMVGIDREFDHTTGAQIAAYDVSSDKIRTYSPAADLIDAVYGILPYEYRA